MRLHILTMVLALGAGVANAQSPASQSPPTRTIQCIDVSGRDLPPLCHVPASRLDKSEYLCTCPANGQRVEVAICDKGQAPPADNIALDRARRLAVKEGTLVGAMIAGQPICVAPRHPYG